MRASGSAAAVGAFALVLAGCTTGATVRPALPEMPKSLAAACRDPGVRAGKTLAGEFARNRQAFAECRRKHGGSVAFYNDIRGRLGAK